LPVSQSVAGKDGSRMSGKCGVVASVDPADALDGGQATLVTLLFASRGELFGCLHVMEASGVHVGSLA
jgi:hypothetical protein